MLQLTREYQLDVYDLGLDVHLRPRHMSVSVCADCPLAQASDYEASLRLLNERVGGWLSDNWDRRWLIASEPEKAHAQRLGIAVYCCPVAVQPANLAEYLLDAVLEPLLRGSGLLVRHVEVWVPGLAAGRASLNDSVADLYEKEMGAKPDDYRRNAPIFAAKHGLEYTVYPYNAWNFHNKAQAKKSDNGM